MTTKISILEHENCGLCEAIILEKKKRKKGKRLNLYREISKGVEVIPLSQLFAHKHIMRLRRL
jgi:carbonic anhydrase